MARVEAEVCWGEAGGRLLSKGGVWRRVWDACFVGGGLRTELGV